MRRIGLTVLLALLAGCATSFSTLQADASSKQVLFTVPEEQAFQLAFSSMAKVLPGYEITDIDGPVKGYSANFRFLLDTYSQQILVIPASANNSEGQRVRGFYYEVSGTGSSGQGRAKNVQLFESVLAAGKATGKAVSVTGVSREPYAGARWRQGDGGRQSVTPAARPEQGPDALTQIERLQQLRDRGAITEDEFQRKKKELLERI